MLPGVSASRKQNKRIRSGTKKRLKQVAKRVVSGGAGYKGVKKPPLAAGVVKVTRSIKNRARKKAGHP